MSPDCAAYRLILSDCLFGHNGLHFGNGLGDGFAKDTATVCGDEDVVFDADSAKVLPLLEFVEVDVVLVGALSMPLIDEGRDEVAAGLIGDDKAGLEATTAAEAAETELSGGARLVVVADVDLAVVFHIVHVEAHHVTETVRHEKTVGTVDDDVIEVALEDAEVLIALGKHAAGGGVDLLIGDAGTGYTDSLHVSGKYNLVDSLLTGIEPASHGDGTGDVGAIVHGGLTAGIHHKHTAKFKFVVVGMIVERLTVDSHDDGEGYRAVALPRLALHEAGKLILITSGHGKLHGADVHVVGGGDSFLYFGNFLGALDAALLDASKDERHGGVAKDGIELDAEEDTHLTLVVGTVGWQVVNLAGLADGLGTESLEGGKVAGVLNTHRGGKLLHTGQRTCPDDIVNVVVIGKNIIFTVIAVEHAYEIFALEAEKIEEGAVLTKPVGVVGIVAGRFVVALDDDEAVAYVLAELFATSDISLFTEHNNTIFKFLTVSITHPDHFYCVAKC